MIFRKCQGSAFDVIDTRQKKIATILSVFLLEGYFRSTFHEKLSQIQEKKNPIFIFFFFCCKRFQFDASSTFHHHYLSSQKKGGKFQEFIFVSLQVFFVSFFCVHLLPDFVLQKDKARMKAAAAFKKRCSSNRSL